MSAPALEAFLARLFSDAALRERFLHDAKTVTADLPLTEIERAALLEIDRTGLQMAAASYANKRAPHVKRRGLRRFLSRFSLAAWVVPAIAKAKKSICLSRT
jgi:hypothetical protein